METNEKLKLFISYSYVDKALVDKLALDILEKIENIEYFNQLINSTNEWKDLTTSGITAADCIIVLITESSINSKNVLYETGVAKSIFENAGNTKIFIPIIYGGLEIPQFLKDYQVIFWQENYEEVLSRIIKAIKIFEQRNKKEYHSKNEKILNSAEKLLRNYWLLLLNPNTWTIEDLKLGAPAFFNTHYFEEKRPEYNTLKHIAKGDIILGLATGDYQSIVCQMEVVEPVGPNNAHGEGIKMKVNKLFSPHIHINNFKNEIPDILSKFRQKQRPTELLFNISEGVYNSILKSENKLEKEYENNFQPFFLTEGNHQATEDQLDFENDVNSFATVIALEKVNPPLAVGLFGNWGSGKSFFMEKLSNKIEQIVESQDTEFVQHVVQVKFNSWHYSDANLWASLISQIFESLNDYAQKKQYGDNAIKAIYKDLNLTSFQLEETQKKLEENEIKADILKDEKDNLEKIIEHKKATLKIWEAKDFISIVFNDPFIKKDFQDIKDQFEEEKLIDNISQIDKKLSTIDSVFERINQSFKIFKENKKGNWLFVWISAIILFGFGLLILGPWRESIKAFIGDGILVTTIYLAWLGNLIRILTPYFNKINAFYKRLKSLKQTIDKEKEKVRLKEHDEVERLQTELKTLGNERNILVAEQKQVEEKKLKLEKELNEIGSGKLLASFLASKSSDDAYIKQLGIISWIRKDFAKLNELFQNQKVVQSEEKNLVTEVQIDRIILYIDDLDRCNEEVVVKVLEAIHLLLAFPLFVVIVGVDPRWLNNALSEKYKNLFGNKPINTKNEENIEAKNSQSNHIDSEIFSGAATSYDYLEKIFQIPFALKPIDKTGREKLIQYLIKEEMANDQSSNSLLAEDITSNYSNINFPNLELSKPITATLIEEDKEKINDDDLKNENLNKKKAKERLVFSKSELQYMQKISSIFGNSPRSINRYVNIYRIIKAHGNLKVVSSFSKEEFMPIMLLLAIIVGYSVIAEKFLLSISHANDNDRFNDFLENSDLNENIKSSILSLTSEIQSLPMKDFKRNLDLTSRFSFRTLLKAA